MNRLLPIDLYAAPWNVGRTIEHCRCLYQNVFSIKLLVLYALYKLYRAKYDEKHWP